MGDRTGRAVRRVARVENGDVDTDSSSGNEILEEVVRSPLGRVRAPAVLAQSTMDPGHAA